MSTVIDQVIHAKVNQVINEMRFVVKEREDAIWGTWVALIAHLHMLMLGPGGTGKSLLSRLAAAHIAGSKRFELTLDEMTDVAELYGPPNIKLMVEDGEIVRVTRGKLPEAHIVMLDEIFNANTPLLHSLHAPLNERLFDNGGMEPMQIPLISMICGTNKLTADADLAPFFDRVHLRYVVQPIQDRDNMLDMVAGSVARHAAHGRGTTTHIEGTQHTMITLEELEAAHAQMLNLEVPPSVMVMFADLRQALKEDKGVEFSDRRAAESMLAVMANAWLRGHEQVQTMDLDILSHMWWVVQDQINEVRSVLLEMVNPNEKLALDLLDSLDEIKKELAGAKAEGMDQDTYRRLAIEKVRNADNIKEDAEAALEAAKAAGTDTTRLEEAVRKSSAFRVQVAADAFNLSAAAQANLQGANA